MFLTKNFNLNEFLQSNTAKQKGLANLPSNPAIYCNLMRLASCLQVIRILYGNTIHVTSGYRCPTLNHLVGGLEDSYHLVGLAADIAGDDYRLLGEKIKQVQEMTIQNGKHCFKVVNYPRKKFYHIQLDKFFESVPVNETDIFFTECVLNDSPYVLTTKTHS